VLAQKLGENKDYQTGLTAMKDHLGDLAIDKFKLALADESLTAKDQQALQLLIVEAYVRTDKPALALQTLQDERLKDHPDRMFWSGIATASSGRFQDAIVLLKLVKSGSTYYNEARLTLANLYQALSDDGNAQQLYTELSKEKGSLSEYAKVRLAELLIYKGDVIAATKSLSELKTESPALLKKKVLLEAKIDLANKTYDNAISKLTELLKSPEHLDKRTVNNAVITLADARYANNDSTAALDGIFTFIEKNKRTAMLSPVFSRIGRWLPADTKLSDSKVLKLKEWAGRNEDQQNVNLEQRLKNYPELTAYAHFYYATQLARSEDPASLSKALFEFSLLRLNNPTHITFGMSLMETAQIQLKLDQREEAIDTLKNIQTLNIPLSPEAKEQAAFISGQLLAEKMDYPEAAKAFLIASDAQQESLANAAAINAGVAYLAASDVEEFQTYLEKTDSLVLKQQLELEKALWLAKKKSIDARMMLQSFIRDYPENSRITEAKLALAENAIRVPPTDSILCGVMVRELSATRLSPEQYPLFTNVRYLQAMSQGQYPAAIETALQFLETEQPEARKREFKLLLGQAYYRNGQHNDARVTLLQLEKAQPDSPLADYALYYAALAARLEGTPQSQNESIVLLQKVIDKKSPISIEATLQLADLYNDTNQPELGYALLKKVYEPGGVSNTQRNIAVNLADSLQKMGAMDEKHYEEAIKVYDQLLAQKDLPAIWFNRIHYSKGYTYENMNLNQEAVNTYYAVVNIDHTKTPITEWKWYYTCGFNAIEMLVKLGNPKAAISVAKKLASTKGPRAAEAAKRARDIEMEHMIWDKD